MMIRQNYYYANKRLHLNYSEYINKCVGKLDDWELLIPQYYDQHYEQINVRAKQSILKPNYFKTDNL